MIRVVPVELVQDLWPAVSPKLSEALEVHPFLSIDDLLWLVMTGRADLIIDSDAVIHCAVVMEVMQYPSKLVGNIVALGGETGYLATGLHSLLDYCEQWAKARSCTVFAMIGRPGWSNFTPKRGGQSLKLIQAWKSLE